MRSCAKKDKQHVKRAVDSKTKISNKLKHSQKITALSRWFESWTRRRFSIEEDYNKPGAIESASHRYHSNLDRRGDSDITIDETKEVKAGQSENSTTWARFTAWKIMKRRLWVLIEVQLGTYLGEDDIIRYEDIYIRVDKG